jgi:hypothetical protein
MRLLLEIDTMMFQLEAQSEYETVTVTSRRRIRNPQHTGKPGNPIQLLGDSDKRHLVVEWNGTYISQIFRRELMRAPMRLSIAKE